MPCPPHRAPADHFVFSMNTDFDAAADEFASAADLLQLAPPSEDDGRGSRSGRNGVNGSSGEEDGEDEFENFLPGLPAAPEPAAAGAAPVAAAAAGAGGSNSLPIHAKDAIERLQTHFEATARVRVALSLRPLAFPGNTLTCGSPRPGGGAGACNANASSRWRWRADQPRMQCRRKNAAIKPLSR